MKKRLLSLVLCLVMVFSLFPAFGMSAAAADPVNYGANGVITNPDPAQDESKALNLTKTLAPGQNGTYDITMESWATGEVKTQVYNEQIPTDYVLIADQSGSMSTNDVPTGYNNGTTKNWKVSDGANAYYYKETDANGVDHYYRVYRKYGDMFQYHARDTVYSGSCVSNLSWFQRESDQDLGKASQYYYNPSLDNSGSRVGSATDNRFYPVTVSAKGGVGYYGIRFRFTDVNGTSNYLRYPDQPYYKSPTGGLFGPGDRWGLLFGYDFCNSTCKGLTGNDSTQYTYGSFLGINTGMYVRQVLFTRHANYSQLAYRDDNGVEHLLINATYCNSSGTPVGGACGANGVPSQNYTSTTEAYWNGTLYTASGTTTRLNALKQAMNEFVNTVAAQQNEDGTKPNHRVAIVGFTSLDGSGSSNTELLTGINLNTSASNKTGIRYNNITTQQYKDALLDVTDSTQLNKLRNAVQALDANGGTEGQYGFYMAKNILDQRELTKFTTKGGNEVDRLTIVVYFTDGTPGNYDNDNQYAYGNEVVDAAHQLKTDTKVPNVEIYSIGTFGFADSEPLVYEKYTGNNDEYKFDPDYVKTLSGTWNSGYMYRLWLRNTQGYGDVATDTVYDYMRTITTEFEGATKFVDASWYGTGTKSDNGVYTNMVSRVRGTSNGLRRYFLCTDLSGLNRVFTTIASEEASSSSTVTLKEDAVLHDTVNTTNFDTENASVSAYTVAAYMNGTFGTTALRTWPANSDKLTFDKTTGEVTVSDFNYSEKFVNSLQDGEKLVVKITGLTAKHPGENMPSNDGNAYIKAPDAEANAIEIVSPTLTLQPTPKTYIIDFNAKMKVADNATKLGATTGTNGDFNVANNEATYKLKGGMDGKSFTASYSGVDTAMIYGVPVGSAAGTTAAWNKITTVPANNIYFDDDLGQLTATTNGVGYNGEVTSASSVTGEAAVTGPFTFTFTGSRIDIYCTTEKNSGGVVATLKQGATVISNKLVSNKFQDDNYGSLYNVPTVVFEDLTPGTEYTVTLATNTGSNYKIDGVRVYNAVAETETNVQKAYSDAGEANSTFLKVRDQMLPSATITAINDYFRAKKAYDEAEDKTGMTEPVIPASAQNVQGVMFYMDKGASTVADNDPLKNMKVAAEYGNYGPKNEIYLKKGEGLSFSIQNTPDDMKAWIGLSAPQGGASSVTVTVNGTAIPAPQLTAVDMYYLLDGAQNGQTITIQNNGQSLISITNVKITGSTKGTPILNAGVLSVADAEPAASVLSVDDGLPYLAVTAREVKSLNAPVQAEPETPEDPQPSPSADPEPTEDPTPTQQPSIIDVIHQLFSSFVNALFGSIARLFGN